LAALTHIRVKNIPQTWLRLAAVTALAGIAAIVAAPFLIGARYHGHSAEYWLRQTLSTNAAERLGASQALQQMGPAADAALVRGFAQKQTIFYRFIFGRRWSSSGRRVYAQLPSNIQRRITDYLVQDDPDGLQLSAEQIVHSGTSRSIGPKLPTFASTPAQPLIQSPIRALIDTKVTIPVLRCFRWNPGSSRC
jgi:hypothetical protein